MKYPKCCYQNKENIFWYEKRDCEIDAETAVMCGESEYYLKSITAETLAELAIERGEDINIVFGHTVVRIGCSTYLNTMPTLSLNEFFLRIAKERKYIKG